MKGAKILFYHVRSLLQYETLSAPFATTLAGFKQVLGVVVSEPVQPKINKRVPSPGDCSKQSFYRETAYECAFKNVSQ
jgi:hypothetical protein